MNIVAPFSETMDFAPAYQQLAPIERAFVDQYVAGVENVADNTGQRLLAVLQAPLPPNLDQRTRGMLARPMVRAAITDRIRELSDVMEVSAYKTVKELKAMAYSNIADFMTVRDDGLPEFDFSKCTREQLSAIGSVKYTEDPKTGRKLEIRFHPKTEAIKMLMQYQGLLAPDNSHYKNAIDSEKTIDSLPADVTDEHAADAYARAING